MSIQVGDPVWVKFKVWWWPAAVFKFSKKNLIVNFFTEGNMITTPNEEDNIKPFECYNKQQYIDEGKAIENETLNALFVKDLIKVLEFAMDLKVTKRVRHSRRHVSYEEIPDYDEDPNGDIKFQVSSSTQTKKRNLKSNNTEETIKNSRKRKNSCQETSSDVKPSCSKRKTGNEEWKCHLVSPKPKGTTEKSRKPRRLSLPVQLSNDSLGKEMTVGLNSCGKDQLGKAKKDIDCGQSQMKVVDNTNKDSETHADDILVIKRKRKKRTCDKGHCNLPVKGNCTDKVKVVDETSACSMDVNMNAEHSSFLHVVDNRNCTDKVKVVDETSASSIDVNMDAEHSSFLHIVGNNRNCTDKVKVVDETSASSMEVNMDDEHSSFLHIVGNKGVFDVESFSLFKNTKPLYEDSNCPNSSQSSPYKEGINIQQKQLGKCYNFCDTSNAPLIEDSRIASSQTVDKLSEPIPNEADNNNANEALINEPNNGVDSDALLGSDDDLLKSSQPIDELCKYKGRSRHTTPVKKKKDLSESPLKAISDTKYRSSDLNDSVTETKKSRVRESKNYGEFLCMDTANISPSRNDVKQCNLCEFNTKNMNNFLIHQRKHMRSTVLPSVNLSPSNRLARNSSKSRNNKLGNKNVGFPVSSRDWDRQDATFSKGDDDFKKKDVKDYIKSNHSFESNPKDAVNMDYGSVNAFDSVDDYGDMPKLENMMVKDNKLDSSFEGNKSFDWTSGHSSEKKKPVKTYGKRNGMKGVANRVRREIIGGYSNGQDSEESCPQLVVQKNTSYKQTLPIHPNSQEESSGINSSTHDNVVKKKCVNNGTKYGRCTRQKQKSTAHETGCNVSRRDCSDGNVTNSQRDRTQFTTSDGKSPCSKAFKKKVSKVNTKLMPIHTDFSPCHGTSMSNIQTDSSHSKFNDIPTDTFECSNLSSNSSKGKTYPLNHDKRKKKQHVEKNKVATGRVHKRKTARQIKRCKKKNNRNTIDTSLFDDVEEDHLGLDVNQHLTLNNNHKEIDDASCSSVSSHQDSNLDYSFVNSTQCSVSSSDEELPDVFARSPSSLESTKFIQSGSLVWTKFKRYPYWPSLINKVYRKKSKIIKVSVIFLEFGQTDGKRGMVMQYEKGKFLPFTLGGDQETYHKFKAAGENQDDPKKAESFNLAYQRAEDFIMQNTRGSQGNSFDYFKEEFSYGLNYQDQDQMSDIDTKEEDSTLRGNCSSLEENSIHEDTLTTDIPTEQNKSEVINSCQSKNQVDPVARKRMSQNKKLIENIKKKETKQYLLNIYNGKEASDLHVLYHKPNQTKEDRAVLNSSCQFGPVSDDNQVEEIAQILMTYSKETSLDDFKRTPYVFTVWFPEAVVFAIHKTRRMPKDRAWDIFKKGPTLSKNEQKMITANLMNMKDTISPEDRERYQLSLERRTKNLKWVI